ncbi:hypothetical protein AAVH_02402 [Aphelenchoides avenae]|nr:hypothetical protein AAVH_02402 [Aphelenchus avenae]
MCRLWRALYNRPVRHVGRLIGCQHRILVQKRRKHSWRLRIRALRDKEAELQSREQALSDKFGQLEMEQRKLAESLEKFEREKQRFELQKSLIAGTLGSAGPLADGTKKKDPFEAEKCVLRLAIQFQDWKIRCLIDQHSENRPAQSAATSVRSTEPTVRASMSFVEALKNVLQKFPDRQLATTTFALFETDVWSTTTAHEVHRFLEDRQLEATPLVSVIRNVAESVCKGQGRSSGSA